MVIERLDPEAIAGNEECLLISVPDREREHAAQILHALGSVLLIEVNDGFRVAVSTVGMSTGNEWFAQAGVVIDLAVEDNGDRAIFVGDGLVAASDVYDAEAAHPDGEGAVGMESIIVGPAVGDDLAHGSQSGRFGARITGEFENSGDPAHSRFLREV